MHTHNMYTHTYIYLYTCTYVIYVFDVRETCTEIFYA